MPEWPYPSNFADGYLQGSPEYSRLGASSSTSSYVCFACRRHRSLPRFPDKPIPIPKCHDCQKQMFHISKRLEAPPHDNLKAWTVFYDRLTDPRYSQWVPGDDGVRQRTGFAPLLDEKRDEENRHWEICLDGKKGKGEGQGCKRCREVEKRMHD